MIDFVVSGSPRPSFFCDTWPGCIRAQYPSRSIMDHTIPQPSAEVTTKHSKSYMMPAEKRKYTVCSVNNVIAWWMKEKIDT